MPSIMVTLDFQLRTHIRRKGPSNLQFYNCDCQSNCTVYFIRCDTQQHDAKCHNEGCDIHFFTILLKEYFHEQSNTCPALQRHKFPIENTLGEKTPQTFIFITDCQTVNVYFICCDISSVEFCKIFLDPKITFLALLSTALNFSIHFIYWNAIHTIKEYNCFIRNHTQSLYKHGSFTQPFYTKLQKKTLTSFTEVIVDTYQKKLQR